MGRVARVLFRGYCISHEACESVMIPPARRAIGCAAVLLAVAGCAHKLPEPTTFATEPHVSWALGAGANAAEDAHACESASESACELRASTTHTPVYASVELHLHAAGSGAIFEGEVRATFLAGGAGEATRVSSVVLADRETNTSIAGIVVDKPGKYEFSYKLVAESVGVRKALEERVPVIVR